MSSTSAPDYGPAHRRLRERWRTVVDAGEADCTQPICIEPIRWIEPGTEWDLAHDRVNGGYHGPAHASCNRSDGHAASCTSPLHDHSGPKASRTW